MPAATYEVCVDWNNDNDFSDDYEDITADIRKLTFTRGRSSDLEKADVGKCRITVHDPDGKYIPENTASPLYGYLLPARPVRVRAVYDSTTYDLFNGFLDDVIPSPKKSKQEAYLPCVDGFDQLVRSKVTMALQENKLSGQLFATALDAVGWSATKRALDAGTDTYPLVHAERQTCLDFLQKLEKSEYGFMYVDGRGYLVWEDRHHRLVTSECVNSQWTITGPKHIDLEPTNSLKSVRNKITISAQPKTKAGSLSNLWQLAENKDNPTPDSPLILPGETITYWAIFADANGSANVAGDVVSPASTTDYLGNDAIDGSGSDRTSDLSVAATIYAGSAKLEVQNTSGTSLYLIMLKIRGKIYEDKGKTIAMASDNTSQTDYLLRELSIDMPYYSSKATLQGLADYQLSIKKDPIPGYVVSLINSNSDILTQILARKLSDRVTLQNNEFNIDDEFYIEAMEHEITRSGTIHKCRWTLTRADDYQYFVWDVSKWDQTTRWAY